MLTTLVLRRQLGNRNLNSWLQHIGSNTQTDDRMLFRNTQCASKGLSNVYYNCCCHWSKISATRGFDYKDKYIVGERDYTRYAASTIMPKRVPNEFRISDYDVIGFDLDNTLLHYNINEMIPLEYEILVKFLVEQKNYAPELLTKPFNLDFMQKGLVLDAEHGNILKLGRDAEIIRAAHGTHFMSKEEIEETYGEERNWEVATQFYKDPLSTWNGPLSEKVRSVLDFFDFTVSLVFAHVVDIVDKQKGKQSNYSQIWADIENGLLMMYTRENFANSKSPYFNALRIEPARYLKKTNPKIIELIAELRKSGKLVFLITGSHIDFANFTASYALGKDWKQLFDCVICFAKKPGFFVQQRNFLPIEKTAELCDQPLDLSAELKLDGTPYSQGNWPQLLCSLSKKIQIHPNNISTLYIGDNILQDVYSPAKHNDMTTVAVCEEMFENNPDYPAYNIVKSDLWGSYFETNCECTMWASLIDEYAKICIPTIDSLLDQPINGTFICEDGKYYRTK